MPSLNPLLCGQTEMEGGFFCYDQYKFALCRTEWQFCLFLCVSVDVHACSFVMCVPDVVEIRQITSAGPMGEKRAV